jgi:hypothetical protein
MSFIANQIKNLKVSLQLILYKNQTQLTIETIIRIHTFINQI